MKKNTRSTDLYEMQIKEVPWHKMHGEWGKFFVLELKGSSGKGSLSPIVSKGGNGT